MLLLLLIIHGDMLSSISSNSATIYRHNQNYYRYWCHQLLLLYIERTNWQVKKCRKALHKNSNTCLQLELEQCCPFICTRCLEHSSIFSLRWIARSVEDVLADAGSALWRNCIIANSCNQPTYSVTMGEVNFG